MNPQRLPTQLTTLGLIICLPFLIILSGCGAKSDGPGVVTPPAPPDNVSSEKTEKTGGAPGEIVMPAEDAPVQPPETQSGSEGLVLPENAPLTLEGPITAPASRETAKVQYATWDEIEKFATSTKRVTVVDLWSTVCPPCIKEFPGLVKLHSEHGDSIQCISVDVDYDGRRSRPPESYEPTVVAILTNLGASFPNYISRTASEEIYATLNVVSIPAVLIFDANGKLVKRFIDADETAGFSYEKDIIPFVTKLAG